MPAKSRDFTLARDLGPSDAPEAREQLLDWLGRRTKTAVVELSGSGQSGSGQSGSAAPVSPLALQLLAATERSAAHPGVRFGPGAQAALAALGDMQAMEEPQR
jgi:hypothetical protein